MTRLGTLSKLLLVSCGCAALAACGADDVASPGEGVIIAPTPTPSPTPTPTPTPTPGAAYNGATPAGMIDRGVIGNKRVFELPTRFTADTTIQNLPGAVYQIAGPVNVGTDIGGDGSATGGQRVTLTVQPGTVFIASSGSDYLVVNRGSRLNAVGTATQPIIFTARAQLDGSVTDSTMGLWGGIIMLGRAPISDCNANVAGGSAACQNIIEGTTSALYGGATADDNSGALAYVQIRYSGFAIAPGNELQGLTLGGVGSGTRLDHIHVHNSSDDGIEIFGGRANLKNLVITGADDDSLDTDLGYKGDIQFVIAVQRDSGNGDSMVEADSNGNEDALPRQHTRLANFTFIQRGTTQGGNAVLLRGGTDYTMMNGIISGPQACIDIDATNGSTTRGADSALDDVGPPRFNSVVLACPTAFRDDNNVAVSAIQSIFNDAPSSGNNVNFTVSLTNTFVNGANETAVKAFDPKSLTNSAFFTSTNYIGAVKDASDTWYAGWTCNSGYVAFGSTSGSCTALPTT